MFDTGEVIESGIWESAKREKKYGDRYVTNEELLKILDERGIDITPTITVMYLSYEEIDFSVRVFDYTTLVKEFDFEVISNFYNYYMSKFGIGLWSDFRERGYRFNCIELEKEEFYLEKLNRLCDEYKLSLKHKEKAFSDYDVKIRSELLQKYEEKIERINNRNNELDILLLPNRDFELFETSELRLVEDNIGISFVNGLNNFVVYKAGNKYFFRKDYRYGDFIYGYSSYFFEVHTLEEFIYRFCKIYKINNDLRDKYLDKLKDFFNSKFKECEKGRKDLEVLKNLMSKEKNFEVVTRTNKKGKTYTNLIYNDYSLSIDFRNKDMINKFNLNIRESKLFKSEILFYIIDNINYLKII